MSWAETRAALAPLEPPFAFVDLDVVDENARRMLAAAGGKPIRIASKSVRSRDLLRHLLDFERGPGSPSGSCCRGLLTFTLPESLWLHEHGFRDLLVAYPSVEPSALRRLADVDPAVAPVIMVDSTEQLDLIPGRDVAVAIDLDVGYWPLNGRLKFGAKRSPIRTPAEARALAAEIDRRPNVQLVGIMAYESQIAGVADRVPGRTLENLAIQIMQRLSVNELRTRRAEMVAAVREVTPQLRFVNGGGTGSIAQTACEVAISEVTAGSGFYAPQLFQYYSRLKLAPAAGFALSINRRPDTRIAAALGGGYIASGATRADRQPAPFWPPGLRLDPLEGAGEVQTPLHIRGGHRAAGRAAAALADAELTVGGRVYLRHAKAGELCERFNTLHVIRGGRLVGEVATYRGDGQAFL